MQEDAGIFLLDCSKIPLMSEEETPGRRMFPGGRAQGETMLDLVHSKTGIVLSGGGAKGAYQIGMFRALEEAGLDRQNLILAGTSIGAMTALAYAAGSTDLVRRFIYGLGDTFAAWSGDEDKEDESKAKESTDDSSKEAEEKADAADTMKNFLKDILPDKVLLANETPVIVCCYNLDRQKPEYFCLDGLSPEDQRKLVMASGSLPGILPPVIFSGMRYLDGGVVPEGLSHPAAADKIPTAALKEEKIDTEIVSYLTQTDAVAKETLNPHARVMQLWPSRPLEDKPHAGTLDFSREKLLRNEQLGYEDTCVLLAR